MVEKIEDMQEVGPILDEPMSLEQRSETESGTKHVVDIELEESMGAH